MDTAELYKIYGAAVGKTCINDTKQKKHTLTVYLSGAIEKAKDRGITWREGLQVWLNSRNFHVINPAALDSSSDYPEKVKDGKLNIQEIRNAMQETINRDVNLVLGSSLIVCLWNRDTKGGAGTHGEITLAKINGIPVIIVNDLGVEIPSWVIGCSTYICDTIEELKGFLSCIYVQWILKQKIIAHNGQFYQQGAGQWNKSDQR